MSNTLTATPTPQVLAAAPPHAMPDADPMARAFDLPLLVTLEVPVISFTVGSLISLAVGCIVETAAQHNEDLELSVNGQLVGTVEIEVTGENLAVRLTGVA